MFLVVLLVASTAAADGKSKSESAPGPTGDAAGPVDEPAPTPGESSPADSDLDVGATCSGHDSAEALTARLPTYARELVLLWPRTGRRTENGTCVTVSRLTAINHQGTPLTVSFLSYERAPPDAPRDFRLLEEQTPPRAVLEVTPDDAHPQVLVEVAGSPSTSRDTLEAILDFLDARAAVQSLVDSDEQPGKVRDP